MWRFKQFMPKEHTGLEGRTLDVGNVKVQVRNALAEGGFSCVYLATDAMQPSKNYALKHMICNDEESLDLAKKEISVLKLLKGHPNVITLHASSIFDMGRSKEALLLMELCEKSLVDVLENRGVGYFEEKQVFLIFRAVCNAVFAMHCLSPPIAHRDLKAENVLLGDDGAWRLCDFGSTSTNHKCFSRPEEMGVEEDVIRKHTTPAYRAPEMWDLYRREIISEKVDIWALGCLLYRIAYLKSAFDGESKLQILNGNYRIPEQPKYSSSLTDLIKDMLQSSPSSRPDITQVWFRVNLLLPEDLQKQMPDNVSMPDNLFRAANVHKEGMSKKPSPVPRRSPPPPPPQKEHSNPSQAPVGAFWSTPHALDLQFDEDSRPKKVNPPEAARPGQRPSRRVNSSQGEDFEIRFDKDGAFEEISGSKSNTQLAFDSFVAEFDHGKVNADAEVKRLEAEVESLKEQLKQSNMEKAEMTSRCEKLAAICRSQRQEIQELKQSAAAAAAIPPKTSPPPQREKAEGSVNEQLSGVPRSVRTSIRNSGSPVSLNSLTFEQDGFVAPRTFSPQAFGAPANGGAAARRLSDGGGARSKPSGSQPSGWAGF